MEVDWGRKNPTLGFKVRQVGLLVGLLLATIVVFAYGVQTFVDVVRDEGVLEGTIEHAGEAWERGAQRAGEKE